MKYPAIKYLLLLLLIYAPAFPQEALNTQLEIARNLFKEGNYFDAITEYKRLLFFDDKSNYKYEGNFSVGASYKKGAYFENAIKYFSLAEQGSKDKKEMFKARIEIIRCNILRRTTDQALLLLNKLDKDSSFADMNMDISYWRGWSYLIDNHWENAAKEFGKISHDHPLRKIAVDVVEESYSGGLAKTLSYVIPGSGQIYSGEVLSGLMSLAWNSLFVYLSIKSFNADRILDGFIYTGLFFRFHRGNLENAGKFAEQNNSEIAKKALLYIQNEYTGQKP